MMRHFMFGLVLAALAVGSCQPGRGRETGFSGDADPGNRTSTAVGATPGAIDRQALVNRHRVTNYDFDTLSSLTVGNGRFAFTVDATGLQSFPEVYHNGIPLGTFSEWGWHTFPDTSGFRYEETLREVPYQGRKITYDVQWSTPERNQQAANWFRQNPHRMHLGLIGLEMTSEDGTVVTPGAITAVTQQLDLWQGEITSHFEVDGIPVEVTTLCHPGCDLIATQIISPLLRKGRLKIKVSFPYPSGQHVDDGCDWQSPGRHRSTVHPLRRGARISRQLDSAGYVAELAWSGHAALTETAPHHFVVTPQDKKSSFTFQCRFSPEERRDPMPAFKATAGLSHQTWKAFWLSGGAVDLSGSSDPRAAELERRIVLSRYLTRIQCTGQYPPQETGLTFNSWYGKFHLEMHWWHAVHYALWGHPLLMEESLAWYRNIAPVARTIARRQGFQGLRWPKMTGPGGIDAPSSVGSYLIWQQPHLIYLAELIYRQRPDTTTLRLYGDLVEATAEFMASYAWRDPVTGKMNLGPWLIPAQERLPAETTLNPPFEVAYWHWGLITAQKWRERRTLPRSAEWDNILAHMPPLAQENGLYLAAESAPDSWSNPRYMGDHPSVTGALGVLPPSPLVSDSTMRATFLHILETWDWPSTWGWDYPMLAMTATRLGMPDKAIDALLMPVQKNSYLNNGHNYQDQRLRIYLPGNGGLLTAVAMMCAGYDGCTTPLPGFPKDGTWNVKWEGLQPMP